MRKLAYIFCIALFLFGCVTLEDMQKKVQQNPNDAIAHIQLGAWYVSLEQYQKAITSCKEAIRINPEARLRNTVSGHYCLGYSYHMLGRFQESVAAYKEAARLNPRLLIYFAGRDDQEANPFNAAISSQVRQTTPQPVVPRPSVQQQVVSGGTGFLFSSRDYIITNWHVVKGAGSIEVKFPNGEVIKAKVLAKDSQNDIAVLKLSQSPSTQIPDLNFGDSSKVRPGDKVFTIGYPASSILGKNQKITDGIVSSITGIEDDPTMFQITVPIQPGNSGGPLFNESGEVIGITTASLSLNAIRSLGAVPQNVNYAIKSSFVNNLLTTIPKTLLSNRGIVVVPNKSGNSLADFFERVSNNIVLIEAKE